MTSESFLNRLLDYVTNHWDKPKGLICIITIILIILTPILQIIKTSGIIALICYAVFIIVTVIIWMVNRKMPKVQKGKVGFIICIQCSDEKEIIKIREDFFTTLRKLILDKPIGGTFQFIEIPQRFAHKLDNKDGDKWLLAKSRAHFLIFGRVRPRRLDNKDYHIFNLDAIVAHRPIPIEVSKQLGKEIRELLPSMLKIDTENDLLAFNFASDWTECVALYIIGIAAYCSLDFTYSEKLFIDLKEKLYMLDPTFPVYKILNDRLPIRYFEIYKALARFHYNKWRINNDQASFDNFTSYLDKIPDDFKNNYEIILLRSLSIFVNERNIDQCIALLSKYKQTNDPVWHLNIAFLSAYNDDLVRAIREYRKCKHLEIQPITLDEVESFLVWVLEIEPDKYQINYCLGFFNWEIKGDLKQAKTDLQKFLEANKDGRFKKEHELAKNWIIEIDKELAISSLS